MHVYLIETKPVTEQRRNMDICPNMFGPEVVHRGIRKPARFKELDVYGRTVPGKLGEFTLDAEGSRHLAAYSGAKCIAANVGTEPSKDPQSEDENTKNGRHNNESERTPTLVAV